MLEGDDVSRFGYFAEIRVLFVFISVYFNSVCFLLDPLSQEEFGPHKNLLKMLVNILRISVFYVAIGTPRCGTLLSSF